MLRTKASQSIKLLKSSSSLSFFHQNRFNPVTHHQHYVLKNEFTYDDEKAEFKLLKWFIPKGTSPLQPQQPILQYAMSNCVVELTSLAEGQIERTGPEEGTSMKFGDSLFKVERSPLYFTTVMLPPFGRNITLPAIGRRIDEWKVKKGDVVKKRQTIVVLEDGQIHVKSEYSGRVLECYGKVGKNVPEHYLDMMVEMDECDGFENLPLVSSNIKEKQSENLEYRQDMKPQMVYVNLDGWIAGRECGGFSIEWLVEEGQIVKKGDFLCELDVDITFVKVPSPYSGKLTWLQKGTRRVINESPFFEIIIQKE